MAFHGFFGGELIAHHLHGMGGRSNEDDTCFLQRSAEIAVLAQESVAGVNGIHFQIRCRP
jgi:hypothetical protein